MMKPHTDELGVRLFSLILEMAPEAKGLFSYLGENENPESHPDFRGHAAMVFRMMCETAARLHERGGHAVASRTLDAIASIHHKRGVLKYHFPLMGVAMLRIVKETVGDELWNEEMENAWRVAFDELSYAILARMRAHESANSTSTLSS